MITSSIYNVASELTDYIENCSPDELVTLFSLCFGNVKNVVYDPDTKNVTWEENND